MSLEKEKAIYRAQMEDSGKPANVIDKIVEGKLGSFYAQVVLVDQPSIRDPKLTVARGHRGREQGARRQHRRSPASPASRSAKRRRRIVADISRRFRIAVIAAPALCD